MKSAITTSGDHSFVVGDDIAIEIPDRRWWRRLWHFATLRNAPTITRHMKITEDISVSTITVSADSAGSGE